MTNASGDFSTVGSRYDTISLVQADHHQTLIDLADLKHDSDILDIGCGTGALLEKLRGITSGRLTGVDPSPGMIDVARGKNIEGASFINGSVDAVVCEEEFNVVFSNSSLQWFTDPDTAIKKIGTALRIDGTFVAQAPATSAYCPVFIAATERIAQDEVAGPIFTRYKNPWFFLETEEMYGAWLERGALITEMVRIVSVKHRVTIEKAMDVFESGAAIGYLADARYDTPIDDSYKARFRAILRSVLSGVANTEGLLDLSFNRVFLVGRRCVGV